MLWRAEAKRVQKMNSGYLHGAIHNLRGWKRLLQSSSFHYNYLKNKLLTVTHSCLQSHHHLELSFFPSLVDVIHLAKLEIKT